MRETTAFGGKDYPVWQYGDFQLPGYKNASIAFINRKDPTKKVMFNFLVGPSSSADQRSSNPQISKTTSGWFIMSGGKNLGSLSLSGYMMDARNMIERFDFLTKYTTYAEDARNDQLEFVNEWSQSIYYEGRQYNGIIQSVSLQKSAQQQYSYQHSITFLYYSDKNIYQPEPENKLSKSVGTILNMESGDGKSLAYLNDESKKVTLSKGVLEILL